MKRVATALVLIPVVLAVIVWAPAWLFAGLTAVVALLAGREVMGLAEATGLRPYRWVAMAAIGATVLVLGLDPTWMERYGLALLVGIVVAVLLAALAHARPGPAGNLGGAGATLLAVAYPGLMLGLFALIRRGRFGGAWLIFMLVVIWLGDTAALYAGRAWGRHKMAPSISPGKSWEGAAASLGAAVVVGAGVGAWQGDLKLIVLAVALNIAGQAGDLVESALKRSAGAKDSGGLLPGHGGVLDRVDAMLLAAPVLWWFLVIGH
ncbi:MAG: phosphatidate cytidylyltransferase [Terriglobales bacterium]